MISEEFKKYLKNSKERFVFVENGKPSYVVMSWGEYQKNFSGEKPLQMLTEEELIDRINSDIALWRESQPGKGEAIVEDIERLEDVEYEVLPSTNLRD